MRNNKHTSGPWEAIEDTDGTILVKTKGSGSFRQICIIPDKISDFDWANAHLISAAPLMLEALEFIVESFPDLPIDENLSGADVIEHLSIHWNKLTKALTKARGE